jgi:cytoskeletal protein CcmA (bactofilin family)
MKFSDDINHTEAPHFDEMTGLLYLEQQLDDDHSRVIAEHANACAGCRELLRVLKNESVWLRGALVTDDEPVPARLVAAPSRGAAPWGWLTAVGFGAAGAYTLWTGFVEPWTTRASDVGFTQGNLMTMLFFSGAFWSGWSDVRDGIEFLAFATLGGVAIWALRRFFRRQTRVATVMGILAFMMMAPFTAKAADTEHGNPNYTLAAGQEIRTDLFVAGDHALIDGNVDGDLIVWAHEVEVNGHVNGDIIAFTQELRMNGTVDGNVRVFAQAAVINGSVGKNLMGFVQAVEVDEKSGIGGSTTLFSQDVQLNGPVKGDLLAFAGNLEIDGPIGGNVKVRSDNLRIGSAAQIAGRTQFEGPRQPDVAPGAKLTSPIEIIVMKPEPVYSTWRYYWHQTLRWGAAFLLGMVMFLLAPGIFLDAAGSVKRVGLAMGIGLLFLVGIPVAAVIACITIVGLGLGIVTLLTYLVAVYMSQVFVGAWVGEKLLGVGIGIGPVLGRLALGLAILRVVRVIPFLGTLSMWVVIVWGLGAYVLTIHKRMRQQAVVA